MVTAVTERIAPANAEALERLEASDPVLVDIAEARDVVPGLTDRMILLSGPPIGWERMCGAQRGAAVGIAMFEGWARDPREAEALLGGGTIAFDANHDHQAAGPMAGTISPSLPVFVVRNAAFGNTAFSRQVEARQQFGDYSATALDGLRKWREVWAPALRQGIRAAGGVRLGPIIAKALEMGDELHNRPVAASSLFAGAMAVAMADAGVPRTECLDTLRYLNGHELFFLGLSMASAKAAADAAHGIPYATLVTAMARNGTEFGIRVSGLGSEWFVAPAPRIQGLFLTGYREEDAGLDMGDSAITETVGWGGFVLGGAPSILTLVGGTVEEAVQYSRLMREITLGASRRYRVPGLDFEGAPTGIDIRKVVKTGIEPIIDTAIAHREPGHGIIGAGLVRAPLECFERALLAFARRYEAADRSG